MYIYINDQRIMYYVFLYIFIYLHNIFDQNLRIYLKKHQTRKQEFKSDKNKTILQPSSPCCSNCHGCFYPKSFTQCKTEYSSPTKFSKFEKNV